MLSHETYEYYRRMSPSQRLQLTVQMMDGIERAILAGSAEQVARKFELLRLQNDQRNRAMLQAIARTRPDAAKNT
jgi:hypothetical protein